MLELAILLRASYFLKHNCHNLVSRMTFFSDHAFLKDSYEMSLGHYDSVVERLIGLGETPDLVQLQAVAVENLRAIPIKYTDNKECFFAVLGVNKTLLSRINNMCNHGSLTQGTMNLLAGIADQLEDECYKLQQRLKK